MSPTPPPPGPPSIGSGPRWRCAHATTNTSVAPAPTHEVSPTAADEGPAGPMHSPVMISLLMILAVPSTRPQPLDLDAMLTHLVAQTGRLVRSLADADLAPLGVAAPGLGVLLRLDREDGLSQAELARQQRVEAPTICRTVDRLARDGLVERASDPSDRRTTRVVLTPAGREIAAKGAKIVGAIETRAFATLDDAERETLAELLGRVRASVDPAVGR